MVSPSISQRQVAGSMPVYYVFMLFFLLIIYWQAGPLVIGSYSTQVILFCSYKWAPCHVSATSAIHDATLTCFTSMDRISTVFACLCQVLEPVRRIFQVQALKWTLITSSSTIVVFTSIFTMAILLFLTMEIIYLCEAWQILVHVSWQF